MGVSVVSMPRLAVTALVLMLSVSVAEAKLLSPEHQEDRMKRLLEDIFRDTRLGSGTEFWGEAHQTDIDRYARLFRTNYYSILFDMGIDKAFARCVVTAKHEPDVDRWFGLMDRFDEAAAELNRKDQARYYFAKGLAKVQVVPEKLTALPGGFYKAAEYGYSSSIWADIVLKAGRGTTGFGSERLTDVLTRFAESYARGDNLKEAYKVYMLAAQMGGDDPDLYLRMVETAFAGGNEKLAYKTALIMLETFDVHDGMREARTDVLKGVQLNARANADELWEFFSNGGLDGAIRRAVSNRPKPDSDEIKPRYLSRFESKYLTNLAQSVGVHADLVYVAACDRYWSDSTAVGLLLKRVEGRIDDHKGAIAAFVGRVISDPRFASNPDVALWESRRWKAAGKLDEFAETYPDRHKLAQQARPGGR